LTNARQERILKILNAFPRTAEEVSSLLNVLPNVISSRFTDLKRLEYIEPTGDREKTKAGGRAQLMRITHKGRMALQPEVKKKPQGDLF